MGKTPLYPASEALAREQGEEPLYRASLKESFSCALYLDQALRKIDSQSGGDEMERLAQQAVRRYGADRVEHVLAASVLLCGPGYFCSRTTERFRDHVFPESDGATGTRDNPVLHYTLHHHPCHIDALCEAFLRQAPESTQAEDQAGEMVQQF